MFKNTCPDCSDTCNSRKIRTMLLCLSVLCMVKQEKERAMFYRFSLSLTWNWEVRALNSVAPKLSNQHMKE